MLAHTAANVPNTEAIGGTMTFESKREEQLSRRSLLAAGLAGCVSLLGACSMSTHKSLEPLSPKVMAETKNYFRRFRREF